MAKQCLDCGKQITKDAKRCLDCHRQSIKAHISICVDCGKTLALKNAKRCRSCATRHQWDTGAMHRPRGKKKHFCIDCGIEVVRRAKRCAPCAGRARWENTEYREAHEKAWSDPEYLQVLRERTQALWQTKEYRDKMLSILRSPEYREKMSAATSGEKNGNWRGGLSLAEYPYEFDDELKSLIRTRDGFTCQGCGEPEKTQTLCCHHIDYDKTNNDTRNLIALCRSCHSQTNSNRKFWQGHYSRVMQEKPAWQQLKLAMD